MSDTSRPAELLSGKALYRAFMVTLPKIEQAALKAGRERRVIAKLRRKFPFASDDQLATVRILGQLATAQDARAYREERERQDRRAEVAWLWRPPWEPRRTQEELREIAKRVHWSRVVYKGGTDEIVTILPP